MSSVVPFRRSRRAVLARPLAPGDKLDAVETSNPRLGRMLRMMIDDAYASSVPAVRPRARVRRLAGVLTVAAALSVFAWHGAMLLSALDALDGAIDGLVNLVAMDVTST